MGNGSEHVRGRLLVILAFVSGSLLLSTGVHAEPDFLGQVIPGDASADPRPRSPFQRFRGADTTGG